MKRLLLLLLLFPMFSFGQKIDVYFPHDSIDPHKVDVASQSFTEAPITVIGVVSGESTGGFVESEYKTQHITLSAWKKAEEDSLSFDKLLVFRTVEKSRNYFDEIPAYSIVAFSLYLNDENDRAVLVEGHFVENPDEALVAAQKKLQEPVFLDAGPFGKFTLNKSISWFEQEMVWHGKTIKVIIDAEAPEQLSDHLETLEELFDNQALWKEKVDDFTVSQLLPLKNEHWLEEDESPWTKERFISTYKLESIEIREDGSFRLWYSDGDIFYGHYIEVSGTIKEGLKRAGIQG